MDGNKKNQFNPSANMTAAKLTLIAIAQASTLVLTGFAALAAHQPGLPETQAQKENYVKENMVKVQAAAECYASHHQGRYPTKIDNAFHSYFPFGSYDDETFSTLSCIYNPYTHSKDLPVLGSMKNASQARSQISARILEGATEYSPVENGKGYVIRGGGLKGTIVPIGKCGAQAKTPFILSEDRQLANRANMMAVQWAAESYYEKHDRFPIILDKEFKNCFPCQDIAHLGQGLPLRNAFSKQLEWPIFGKLKSARDARFTPPGDLKPGSIEYNPIDGGKDYAIRAGDVNGKAIMRRKNPRQTLILSRDGEL